MVTPYKFRDKLVLTAPKWLQRTNGYRLLFSLGSVFDALADSALLAVKCRYPGLLDPVHTLPYLGRDRKMRRGLNETSAVFAGRLKDHLDVNRRRGLGLLMLEQIKIMLAPAAFDAWIVHNRGTSATPNETGMALKMDSSEVFTNYETPWYWDDTGNLSRFWLILSVPDADFDPDGYWGDPGQWGDGGYWGTEEDPSAWMNAIKSVIQDFTPANMTLDTIIILRASDTAAFWASPPDGDWDRWANRNPAALYS
jgi:hypothetical protein